MEPTQDELSVALSTLCKYLREDKDYFYSWQANIAVAFQDEYQRQYEDANGKILDAEKDITPPIHEVANEAAKNFLNLLIYVDTKRD